MYTHVHTQQHTRIHKYASGVSNVHYLLEVASLSALLLLLYLLLLHAASAFSAVPLAVDHFHMKLTAPYLKGRTEEGEVTEILRRHGLLLTT